MGSLSFFICELNGLFMNLTAFVFTIFELDDRSFLQIKYLNILVQFCVIYVTVTILLKQLVTFTERHTSVRLLHVDSVVIYKYSMGLVMDF